MKQLLFIIITFLFVSNVYAQSAGEILSKGKVVSFSESIGTHNIIVGYKNKVYYCWVDYKYGYNFRCRQLEDYNKE